jgi:hypothetical protein
MNCAGMRPGWSASCQARQRVAPVRRRGNRVWRSILMSSSARPGSASYWTDTRTGPPPGVSAPAVRRGAGQSPDGSTGYCGQEVLRHGLEVVWGAEPAGTLQLTLNPRERAGTGRCGRGAVGPADHQAWSATSTGRHGARDRVPAQRITRIDDHPPNRAEPGSSARTRLAATMPAEEL